MKTQKELLELADILGVMVLARRRMKLNGDTDGVELMNRYFAKIEAIDARLVPSAEKAMVGCGMSLGDKALRNIKYSVREELGEPQEAKE